VEIDADITSGPPGVHLVGLPDAALQESRDRVRARGHQLRQQLAHGRLTPTLSPATPPKMGSVYDMSKRQMTLF
jgi:magnesium chelatase family protein